jgi:hypothetical protein
MDSDTALGSFDLTPSIASLFDTGESLSVFDDGRGL